MLKYGYMADLLANLNGAQKRAVVHDQGPLLIVAGAGTGKTSVITSKIAWLVMEKGIAPDDILALTFTEQAAAEMEERVDRMLPLGYADLWISTFHSFAERILKEHALDIGLPQDYKLLNTTQQWLLVKKNLDKFNLNYFRPLGNPTKFIHALLKLFSRAKDENISAAEYLEFAESLKQDKSGGFIRNELTDADLKNLTSEKQTELANEEAAKQQEIADAFAVYQRLLLENNALDFGDLINYTLKLFQARPGILFKYQNKFKYILVDEFQDVNWAQYELIKILAAPKNNLTVVGDDDQSIYAFRGSSISNIMHFKDDYPASSEIYLIDNYRSSQGILDLSYNFIQRNNPDRLEIKLQGADKLSKKLISHSEASADIRHLHGKTINDEVELVVNTIIERYNSNKENNWSDFAILVRSNMAADDFCRALELAQVPHIFLASRGLYHKPVILNILNWFRVLDDYHESSAFYRVLNFPFWAIDERDVVNLNYWSYRKGWSLYEVARNNAELQNISDSAREKLKIILGLIDRQTKEAKANKKPSQILTEFLNASGYLKLLAGTDSLANRDDLNCLNQFYRKMADFEKDNAGQNLSDFMQLMELELEAGETGALSVSQEDIGPDMVKIMTIHGSKGLEFKYVFIANMVDKKFPSIGKSDPIELPSALAKEIMPTGDIHLAEERRLFYVAMTRAKEGLYFSSAEDYGGARAKKLSRFLTELSEDGFKLAENALVESLPIGKTAKQDRNNKVKMDTGGYKKSQTQTQFSFTQLKAYENCPYQYRFSHVLRIQVTGKPQFTFGKTMHAVMQKFFLLARAKSGLGQTDLFEAGKPAAEIAWEEVRQLYIDSFIDDWYPDQKTKDEYYERGLISLKNFFSDWQAKKHLADKVEFGFTYKLNGGCALRGAIDRIDICGDGIKLVDYKTGSPKAKLTADDKEQLLIYQMAAQDILKQKVSELAFYYFDNNSEISFLGKDSELEKLREKIIATADEINTGNFPAKPEKERCRWCDFKNICDFAV